MAYGEYYAAKLRQGQLFEDFVRMHLSAVGMHINIFSSRDYQLQHGETPNGAEVKYDDVMATTGNLWIEIKEKSHPSRPNYVASGIYRKQIAFYIQGDMTRFYIFPINALRCAVESNKYRRIENKTKTSIGVLLPEAHAEAISQKVVIKNDIAFITEMAIEERCAATAALSKRNLNKVLFDKFRQ